MSEAKKLKALTEEFLKNKRILIVEPSSAFANMISNFFGEFGADAGSVIFARNYEDALRQLNEAIPHILISEYSLGSSSGLMLMEVFEKLHEPASSVSIIISKESSDSAVAEAAEEQVDAFMVKPFSVADFEKRFSEVVQKKMHPSPYTTKIREGKALMKKTDYVGAIKVLAEAKKLSDKPISAYCYSGESLLKLKDYEKAFAEFSKGVKMQPLHYRCLIGEFESLLAQKKYKEAYTRINTISKNFPVTTQRLGTFFVATVYAGNFKDLPHLYEIYKVLDHRPAALSNLVSSAFLLAGRLSIRSLQLEMAGQYFEVGSVVAKRSPDYLEKVIDEFIAINDANQADRFFKLLPIDEVDPVKAAQLKFKIDRFLLPADKVIASGRQLVTKGNATPEILKILVELIAKAGKSTLAESVIQKGLEKYPDLRKELFEILEANAVSVEPPSEGNQ